MGVKDRSGLRWSKLVWGFYRTYAPDYTQGSRSLPDGGYYYPQKKLGPGYCPHLLGIAFNHNTGLPFQESTRWRMRKVAKIWRLRGRVVRLRVTYSVK